MGTLTTVANHLFTLEQANRMLPLLRRIAEDIAYTHHAIVDRQTRIKRCRNGEGLTPMHAEEIEAFEETIEEDRDRLGEYLRELEDLGVILKDAKQGGISFPAIFSGRLVFLSWKLGEPRVDHWHELDAGFAGRQILSTLLPDLNGIGFEPLPEIH